MTASSNISTNNKLILISSGLFLALFYFSMWIEGWTGVLFLAITGLIGIIIIFLILYSLYKTVINRKYIPSVYVLAPVLALLIVTFRPVEKIIEGFKSPVVLYGYCEHTVTGLSLKLRANNTFEYNAGAFLSKEMYYGFYNIKNDTLILNFDGLNPENIINKLIVNKDSVIEISDSLGHRHTFKTSLNKIKQ